MPLDALVPVAARVAELPGSDVDAYALELPDGGELVVWGITYAILERLRALPGYGSGLAQGLEQPRARRRRGATARCGSRAPPAASASGIAEPCQA